MKRPNALGIAPVNLLSKKKANGVNWPSIVGIVEVNLLEAKSKYVSFVNRPISLGIEFKTLRPDLQSLEQQSEETLELTLE